MSFKGSIEIVTHFKNFKNIDLSQQGIYMLKVNIFEKLENGTYFYAQPYNIIKPTIDQKKATMGGMKGNNSYYRDSQICDLDFYTRAFIVRYQDEVLELDDICQFRAELDTYPKFDDENLYFQVELFKADLGSQYSQELNNTKNPTLGFVSISVHLSQFHNIFNGIQEYSPIIFDKINFCIINSTIHTAHIDYKFRTSNNQMEIKEEEKKLNTSPQSFQELFIQATSNCQKKKIDKFYHIYVKQMKNNYEKLIESYKEFINICYSEDKQPQYLSQIPLVVNAQHIQHYLEQNGDSTKEESKQDIQAPNKLLKVLFSQSFNFEEQTGIELACHSILQDINDMAGCYFQFWFQYTNFLSENLFQITQHLEIQYQRKIKERWGESIFKNELHVKDLTTYNEPTTGKSNDKIANIMRNNEYYQSLLPFNVQDVNMFPKATLHPIIFQEVYINEDFERKSEFFERPSQIGEVHVVVLVHGFQGNQYDMRILQNNLILRFPDNIYHSSTSNHGKTDGDLWDMGKRLANEVRIFIRDNTPNHYCQKLSFIGHSMGGLIIRSALVHLQDFKDKFHTIMTLSSPHLGYLYHESKMIDAGLWFIKTWKQCQSLKQLTLSDSKNLEDTFIYKLSKKAGLNQFRNIVLVSSYQDSYVPWFSARVQKNPKAEKSDSSRAKHYSEIVESILTDLNTDRIHRIDVSFKINEKNLDSMIGRAAHMQFLENQSLMKMFVYCFDQIFI